MNPHEILQIYCQNLANPHESPTNPPKYISKVPKPHEFPTNSHKSVADLGGQGAMPSFQLC